MKLNLGCGRDIKEGYINLDIVDYGGNMVCDITKFPYPFDDNVFDEVYASHVLEHLDNFHKTISELYRILKPGGILVVYAPFFLNTKYFGEPDHKIPFSIRTFDNYEFIGNRKLKFYEKWKLTHRTNYEGKAQFEVLEKKFITSHFALLKWMDLFINLEPVMYERFFAGIFSPEEVYFKLRAVK
ncbi:MAG: class I SAM-dependent methyltransferase [Bacteroidota bacterium]